MKRIKRPKPKVAIIGAGFGGIAAAVKLATSGIADFTVYERSAGPGGVWWDNRYPGAEVDTPSHMYSFSFKRYDWSRSHAQGAELQRYMQETIDDYSIGHHFHYESEVTSVRWNESSATYTLAISTASSDTVEVTVDFVVSAVGMLNVPRYPSWPGIDGFTGVRLHTSEWDDDIDVTGKRVAVVGTGSTAVQVVPNIAVLAKQVYVYQREPGWINPKPVHEFTEDERRALTGSKLRYKYRRLRGYFQAAATREGGDIHIDGSKSNIAAMNSCIAYIKRSLPGRPLLQAAVTPAYGYFGKRPIKDSNFYPALMRENVELVPSAVTSISGATIADAAGGEREVDVLITATGFQPSNYLARLKVYGRDGLELHDFWSGEPRAYLGITVPGFPNFFMLYGPNTNSPVTVLFLETQAAFALRSMRWARRFGGRTIEVRRTAFERFDRWCQQQMLGSVWASANNYFRTSSGRVVTQWPVSPTRYWLMARLTARVSARVRGG